MAEKITAYKGERGEMGEEEDLLFLLRHPEPPTPPPPATGYSTNFFWPIFLLSHPLPFIGLLRQWPGFVNFEPTQPFPSFSFQNVSGMVHLPFPQVGPAALTNLHIELFPSISINTIHQIQYNFILPR